ncbi:hypothetical protein ZWY2020_038081 [Hordeum vulgare]|nr:hypothetical protein ZWY2020_038081 [Hordeum vulgare]
MAMATMTHSPQTPSAPPRSVADREEASQHRSSTVRVAVDGGRCQKRRPKTGDVVGTGAHAGEGARGHSKPRRSGRGSGWGAGAHGGKGAKILYSIEQRTWTEESARATRTAELGSGLAGLGGSRSTEIGQRPPRTLRPARAGFMSVFKPPYQPF